MSDIYKSMVGELKALAASTNVPKNDGDTLTFEHKEAKKLQLYYSNSPVIFVNGMLNSPGDHAMAALAMSYVHMRPVIGVYNKSQGGFTDFLQCIGDKLSLNPADPKKLLAALKGRTDRENMLRSILSRNPAQLALFDLLLKPAHLTTPVIAHSQGNLILANVLTAISILRGTEAVASRKVESYASPTAFWPAGLNREEQAFTFDYVSWLGGIDLTFGVSKVGMPSGSLNPLTHAFLEYVKKDATFFVNRFRWGGAGVTISMDEAGLAKALVKLDRNLVRVYSIFDHLRRNHNSDSDDVAVEYIRQIKSTALGAQVQRDPRLKTLLKEILSTGIVTSSDREALKFLGY